MKGGPVTSHERPSNEGSQLSLEASFVASEMNLLVKRAEGNDHFRSVGIRLGHTGSGFSFASEARKTATKEACDEEAPICRNKLKAGNHLSSQRPVAVLLE